MVLEILEASPGASASPADSAVRTHLEEVLSSRPFAASPRLCGFLRFVVEKTLAGEAAGIKEYVVATEVYGRGADYDPQIDSTVRVEASRLRAKLRDYYREAINVPVRIELPKGSYVPLFRVAPELPAVPSAASPPEPAPLRRWPALWPLPRLAAAAALLGLLLASGVWLRRPAKATTPRLDSVAVLPFIDLSGGAGLLADGLTEELTSRLATSRHLRVPARTTMYQYKDRPVDVREVGRQTRTKAVLEGSLRREGDRVRFTVQLIDASNGYHLWADTFEQAAGGNALSLQQDAAARIAHSLTERVLSPAALRPSAGADDPELAAEFLRADRLLRQPVTHTQGAAPVPPAVAESIRLFESITRRAPAFARAWVALAEAQEWAYELDSTHPRTRLDAARQALDRALRLDPHLPDAHSRLASVYLYGYADVTRAAVAARRAVELNPRDVRSQARYADILRLQGRLPEALHELRRALLLEPSATRLWAQQALLLHDLDRYDEAIAAADHVLQLDAGNGMHQESLARWVRGLSLDRKGDPTAAEASFRAALAADPADAWNLPALGHLLARTGRHAEARSILSTLQGQQRRGRRVHYAQALIHTGLGDTTTALDCLERGRTAGESDLIFIALEKRFHPLHHHPRFDALLRS